MPLWLWLIVLGGLGYGLLEVGLRDRRTTRHRARRMHAGAAAAGFAHRPSRRDRELTVLLAVVRCLERPGGIDGRFDGVLGDGTPATVFEFAIHVDRNKPEPCVGFVLHYPTWWPTVEFAGTLLHHDGHDLATVLLASDLCEHLAHQRDWTVTFSGGAVLGAAPRGGSDDFERVLRMAEGVASRLPAAAVVGWPAADDRHRRSAPPSPHQRRAS
jgi:hypothetical protein